MVEIINGDALRRVVAGAIEGGPPSLAPWRRALERLLLRSAADHDSIRRARRRKADPEWAKRKFDLGQPLYRFCEDRRLFLESDIADIVDKLGKVADIAMRPDAPFAREARKVLDGLAHHRDGFLLFDTPADRLLDRMRRTALVARRHEVLRPVEEMRHAGLAGRRCTTIGEVMALGRAAGNCLRNGMEEWGAFADGDVDIWSLHRSERLLAVLEVARRGSAQGTLSTALGPRNTKIGAADAPAVAAFCRAAGIVIRQETDLLLPEFTEPPLLGPRTVVVGRAVAVFVEWPAAVRVDIQSPTSDWRGGTERLALSFDPGRSLAEAVVAGDADIGGLDKHARKLLRKVVCAVAMEQAAPSLVQHRLLALAA